MLGLGIVLIQILVWGGLFGGGGLSLLLYGRKLNQKPAPPSGWQVARGKVTSIEVARIPKPGSGMSGFAPVMGYSYDVNGGRYDGGETVQRPNIGTDSVSAGKLKDRYPVGTPVTIYYNPSNPREALVEVNAARGNFFVTAGIGLLVFAALLSCGLLAFGIGIDLLAGAAISQ